MAFNDLELQRHKKVIEKFLEHRRPPAGMRGRCDVGHRIAGHSVEIFEIQAGRREGMERMEIPVAKATFVRSRNRWRVYWMKRDLRWHAYEPAPEAASLEDFLDLVHEDACACFWG